MSAATALLLLLLFQVKHLIADFLLQTTRMLEEKGRYLRLGGLLHSGLHAALSLPVMLLVGVPLVIAVTIAVVEFLIHYHIDWTKDWLARLWNACPKQRNFWVLIGADQFAHQLTYLGMVGWLAL